MSKKSNFPTPFLSGAVVPSFPNEKGIGGRLIFNSKEVLTAPKDCPAWQKERLEKAASAISYYDSPGGPVWILSPHLKCETKPELQPDPWLQTSSFAQIRDGGGQVFQQAQKMDVTRLEVQLPSRNDEVMALLAGFEIASYRFKPAKEEKPLFLRLMKGASAVEPEELQEAEWMGWSVNVARHLTNMPANELNPATFAGVAKEHLSKLKGVEVSVWDKERLRKEKMNLLLAVGGASATPPCLLHLRYRPSKKSKTIALVGKGITFDSGGLDIKTSSGMRLMKKDMGGAAAVFGAFLWAASMRLPIGIDAYLPVAENAIGSQAFRPGDVYVSRSGQSVEITNTDAEGRLVLADALDVAVTQKEAPDVVINLATLTGAIKVGLGSALAGLFSNHVPLAEELRLEFWRSGDPVWIMPLYQKYRSSMITPFADMINSVEAPFAGAVTAALFLESFVKGKPWAHLDIYAWKDAAEGAWSEAGGSGQGVLGLIHWLKKYT